MFVQELRSQAALHGCTVFLLTTASGQVFSPEYTMVDGIVELVDQRYGSRSERSLYVNKLRGSAYLPGRHPFRITSDGLVVYPRIEATFGVTTHHDKAWPGKLSVGVKDIDAMLGGGVPEASVTGLLGPSGIGKTTMGLHFLSESSAKEPGLHFGFYETPPRLLQKAARLGLDLEASVRRGDLELLWQALGENPQDALAHGLLEAVDRRGVRRLFLDGLGGFIEASIEPGRISRFFSVLANELRARGVTMLYTIETQDIFETRIRMPLTGMSSLVENLIALRYVESGSRSRRLLSVVKVRDSGFDPAVREFVIDDGSGVSLAGAFQSVEELSSGTTPQRAKEGSSSVPEAR
jgi:circadian clock protein KaiC